MKTFVVVQRVLTFAAGLAGIGYETLAEHQDRPVLLGVFATMIGIQAFFATEAKLPGGKNP